MTEFLMIRHGEPNYDVIKNWAKISVASNFAPLTEEGIYQIYQTAKLLKDENADLIISSPYTRALQGAAILSQELGLEIRVEPMLYEWQLDSTQSVRHPLRMKHLVHTFQTKNWNQYRKWESSASVRHRVLQVLEQYKQYNKVIVAGHAMMIGYTTGDVRAYEYGEIKRFYLE